MLKQKARQHPWLLLKINLVQMLGELLSGHFETGACYVAHVGLKNWRFSCLSLQSAGFTGKDLLKQLFTFLYMQA